MLLRRYRLALAGVISAAIPCLATAQRGVSAADSVAAVAARQMELGAQWFQATCIQCHAVGAVTNDDFRLKWNGRTAYELFERVRSTMPQSSPGSLGRGTYLAIVAYLMKLNGMPSAGRPVVGDSTALASVRLLFPLSSTTGR